MPFVLCAYSGSRQRRSHDLCIVYSNGVRARCLSLHDEQSKLHAVSDVRYDDVISVLSRLSLNALPFQIRFPLLLAKTLVKAGSKQHEKWILSWVRARIPQRRTKKKPQLATAVNSERVNCWVQDRRLPCA